MPVIRWRQRSPELAVSEKRAPAKPCLLTARPLGRSLDGHPSQQAGRASEQSKELNSVSFSGGGARTHRTAPHRTARIYVPRYIRADIEALEQLIVTSRDVVDRSFTEYRGQ